MIERELYKRLREAYFAATKTMYRPLTDSFIIHLVGTYGLDILINTKYIEPTSNLGQYVLCCEV